MLQEFISSKIHRATVTDANLNYVGSITIDETLMKASKIKEWQKVDILDIDNGERFHTYVIKGEADTGKICLNGAAARKVQPGDKVIIIAYGLYNPEEMNSYKPTIVMVDEKNKISIILYICKSRIFMGRNKILRNVTGGGKSRS
jgi:aspartate 1-decarboxylase